MKYYLFSGIYGVPMIINCLCQGIIALKGVAFMRNKKPVRRYHGDKPYSGIFRQDPGDFELDDDIVSANEMTGAVPTARREPYDEDAFEEYLFN